ncbi:MAG: glycosyltransferase [Micrococcales bacterium]|nr:glycosyltransferase [Micrococcales bacterium]MCL2667831.1 glycosyltransferase [Micrococcales bacterium]
MTARIVVLLATFNGMPYLPDQLRTILDQQDVAVRVVASDDGSSDGTAQWLAEQALTEPRLTLLPAQVSGSAASNFYRLLLDAELDDDELVALADQDDLWYPDKLATCAAHIEAGCSGVSSDVMAFGAHRRRSYIRKAFAQRRFDHVCEAPGPGTSFLLAQDLVTRCRTLLADADGPMRAMTGHDWAIYAAARGAGLRWKILDTPTLDYRQHEGNVMGARLGVRAYTDRLRLVTSRWHRHQSQLAIAVARSDTPDQPDLRELERLLHDTSARARWSLARHANQLRRRRLDQAALATMVLLGVW